MSGTKFDRKNIKQIFANPIIIVTFVGLILWVFQANMPQVEVLVKATKPGTEDAIKSFSIFRIAQTLP